jgi:magnesium chelatase family protein
VVEGLKVYPIRSVAEAVGFLSGQLDIDPEAVDLDEVFRQCSHMEDASSTSRGGTTPRVLS